MVQAYFEGRQGTLATHWGHGVAIEAHCQGEVKVLAHRHRITDHGHPEFKALPMAQLATLHIDKQAHKFSAAHFTIFSETERERLHGHNYGVSARIVAEMGENGFSADYNVYKRYLQKLCDAHDEYMLLPGLSPWLTVEERDGEYFATFSGKTLRFPVDETLVLPIVNVTVEALAHYLLERTLEEAAIGDLVELELFVTSGDGQKASACWQAS